MSEELPYISYNSHVGMSSTGQNNLFTGPVDLVSQRTVCKDNQKAVMTTGLIIKNIV